MPAATTHVEFAKDVLRTHPEIAKRITNKHLFWLGSQGPDMLFFSHMSCMPGSLHKYGNMMHEKKVYETIHFFEEYAKENPELENYVLGYLCHYALDSLAHPLVYAVSAERGKKENQADNVIHVSMESEIDVWILNQRGRKMEDYDVYAYLTLTKEERDAVAEMYHEMFQEVYGLNLTTERISHSIYEVALWTKFIRPRKGVHNFVYKVENLAGGNHFLTGMMLYDSKPGIILNIDHRSYKIPWCDEWIQEDFPSLYGKATQLAAKLIDSHTEDDFKKNFNGAIIEG